LGRKILLKKFLPPKCHLLILSDSKNPSVKTPFIDQEISSGKECEKDPFQGDLFQ
jgi:hypothetical protein